ncbi:MAG: uracil-DNA glycosylase [Clostridiales bacterium]|nr:uracil-DNA glycosylase [Clostridiales bacterium]
MLTWNELEEACKTCQKCKLSETRNNIVFGEGNKSAKIIFISEAPGEQEDLTGRPYVGKSGKLFDKIIASVNISREEIYLANILKCRPPNNRDPLNDERKTCLPYLRNQVKLIHPKIIVCLGRVAAQTIIDPSFKITKDHGRWIERNGYYLFATFHPSALLRDPSKKRIVWEDFKEIKRKYDTYK